MELRDILLDALAEKYRGEKAYHKANIEVYLCNPVGIGEHPDVLEAIDSELAKFVEAEEKLQALIGHWEF